ncbi:hypothetical protein [Paenibacillus sp. FSL R5-0378]|uniref:hypothetical protein n=1 Tax=Paenibacillus sp. FSL R5-0378 TaxID=2921637 RepID=UPI0040470390
MSATASGSAPNTNSSTAPKSWSASSMPLAVQEHVDPQLIKPQHLDKQRYMEMKLKAQKSSAKSRPSPANTTTCGTSITSRSLSPGVRPTAIPA